MSSKSFTLNNYKSIKPFKKIIEVDSDKSLSIRSFLIGAISQGISKTYNVLESEDVYSTINCLKKRRVKIEKIKRIMKEENDINKIKILLANEATKLLHGEKISKDSEKTAQDTFKNGGVGKDLPEIKLSKSLN